MKIVSLESIYPNNNVIQWYREFPNVIIKCLFYHISACAFDWQIQSGKRNKWVEFYNEYLFVSLSSRSSESSLSDKSSIFTPLVSCCSWDCALKRSRWFCWTDLKWFNKAWKSISSEPNLQAIIPLAPGDFRDVSLFDFVEMFKDTL